MTKQEAKQVLAASLKNLTARQGQVSTTDLETEVINLACLYILRNNGFGGNSLDEAPAIARAFTDAALELYPNQYTPAFAAVAQFGIPNNVEWDGMWAFLESYFWDRHGTDISSQDTQTPLPPMAFDRFPPFQEVRRRQIAFCPSRYEVWAEGKMVRGGRMPDIITFIPKTASESGEPNDVMKVAFGGDTMLPFLRKVNYFDAFFTLEDRLMMATVPSNVSRQECPGLVTLAQVLDATRGTKTFQADEPYCCSLFYAGGELEKVTFTISRPEVLIEFYQ